MRTARIITIPLIGILFVLAACGGGTTTPPPVTTTPPPVTTTPPPTTPPPTTPPPTTPPPTTPPPTTPPTTTPPTTPPTTTPTGPANFVLSNVRSVPQDGVNNPKWMTAIFFTVTNTGAQSGTYNIAITLDGTPFDLTDPLLGNKTLSVTLGSLEKADLVVNVTEESGSYVAVVKANGGDVTLPVKLTWIER